MLHGNVRPDLPCGLFGVGEGTLKGGTNASCPHNTKHTRRSQGGSKLSAVVDMGLRGVTATPV
eukprot:CAMPEP_0185757114 /NCGR_PEP_ID=MMETSP1174-20130828/15569_1 /TAXON_ID=35687 /ORGANISM="Dictyocha speculum, Strain CCMP1381" /LENGTH=62 /DNA_ID=CAMNT_0028436393 /DNA_START=414 /DNA_END=602 /DNA_ORIENTATION=-